MNKEITLQDIEEARDRCATIIYHQGEQYLPIFERLEQEIEARKKQDRLLERVHKIATENGTENGTRCSKTG